jgi:hypothetical protein
VRQLDLPGCVVYSNNRGRDQWEFDLTSGRVLEYRATRDLIGVLSPDGRYYAHVNRAADDSYTLYVQAITDDLQPSAPIAIQQGIGSNLGLLITNNRFVWQEDMLAFVWVGTDDKVNLTVARVDGHESKQRRFITKEATSRLSSIRLLGLSADAEFLAVDEGRSSRLRGTSYSFWSLQDMALIPTLLDQRPVLMGRWSGIGRRFAALTGSDGEAIELVIFEPGDDTRTIRVPVSQKTYVYLDWSPDDRYLMAASLSIDADFVRRWSYDIFSVDGSLLYSDIRGDRTIGAGAGTLLTGMWADQTHLLYLKERPSGRRASDLVLFDVSTGLHHLLAVNIITPFTSEMFYVSPYMASSAGATVSLIVVPQGNHLLIPRWSGNKVTVELASFDGKQRITLVENADLLFSAQTLVPDGVFWSADGEWARLLWVASQNGRRRAYLTVARADGTLVRTFDDNLEDITGLKSVYFTEPQSWLGFISERDRSRGIELFNAQTGQHHRLVNGLDRREQNWQISISPNGRYALVSISNILGQEGSRLYVVPVEGGRQVEVTQQMLGTAWSHDGLRAIYLLRESEDKFTLEMVNHDGTSAGSIPVGNRLQPGIVLQSWTQCEMGSN